MGYHFLFYVFAFAKSSLRDSQSERELGDKALSGTKQERGNLPPVSVIVCAKNEAENLKKHIPVLLQQDYPNFEIVLINDASSDQTKAVMEAFVANDARVKQVNVENIEAFWGSKKYALTLGIKAATHERLLFIDADCYPKSSQWIRHMVWCSKPSAAVVLGYGGYQKIKHSWLNTLIRYETVYTAMQYFSYALAGNPYMGVGRNLMYTKTLFFEQRGFINHMKIPSGDDDLFVNEAATSKNTAVCFHPEAHTLSPAKSSFTSWLIQKRRHVSVARFYQLKDKLLLGGFFLSQLGFFVSALVVGGTTYMLKWVVLLVVLRYLIAWIAVGKSAAKLKEIEVAYLFPLHELFLILFQLGIFSANLISKPKRWK
ncbi:MAG: glycosyl transferase family 2 [Cytophagaceae bacterium]|jgi:glycosyltransferase involved in cell wall biosynthesis|nr:glycosyl transferase family 2 [Cytophagaceae bacterium]